MPVSRSRRSRLTLVGLLALVLSAWGLALGAPLSVADTVPTPGAGTPAGTTDPATVSADALPTWQINGVVWAQVVVGNTVYATGSFTKARPPGAASGSPSEIPVGNLIAYDITTGQRISSFSHTLNAQGMAIEKSADGSRIYVGGDFTTVDGQPRGHIAAFDTATGALVTTFAPSFNSTVRAIAVAGSTIYVGGQFTSVNGAARGYAASVRLNGSTGSWRPWANDGYVWALQPTPDGSKVVLGGQFTMLNGVAAAGQGAVGPDTGVSQDTGVTTLPWAANKMMTATPGGGVDSLKTDGQVIWGSAWAFGSPSNFEGAFAARPSDGSVVWANDCHGDTYDTYQTAGVLYTVGHAHECTMIGGFPDTNPRVRWQRALALTSAATGTNDGPDSYGWNYKGVPSGKILQWFPTLDAGSYTGQYQAAWTVEGNGTYAALGGEFPAVNGVLQQGLTRFALKAAAPNKFGPQYSTDPVARTVSPTVAKSLAPGLVRVSFATAWDRDNQRLTYEVIRDGGAVACTAKVDTSFWTLPDASCADTGASTGSHSYRVRISDPLGNTLMSSDSNTVTAVAGTPPAYVRDTVDFGATRYWRLGEASGMTAADLISGDNARLNGNYVLGQAGVLTSDTAVRFDPGTATKGPGYAVGSASQAGPQSLSIEAWFKTTTTTGGKIVGFGNATTDASTSYDRHVYMDNAGRIFFGVWPNAVKTVNSAASFNDGKFHHVVGTLGAAGMALYIDGALVANDARVTSTANPTGYWHIASDAVAGWPSAPTSRSFGGSVDEVAVYPTALTPQQVSRHFADIGGNQAPVAAFTSSAVDLVASFDASGSSDPDGSIASYAWDFGDGGVATGVKPSHTYAAAGTYTVKLTVTDNGGATNVVSHPVTVSAAAVTVLARDLFERTVTGGWGTADVGGPWTVGWDPATLSVAAGVGQMAMSPGQEVRAYLAGVSSTDTDLRFQVSLDKAPTGNGVAVNATVRGNYANAYRGRVWIQGSGAIVLQLTSAVNSAESYLDQQVLSAVTYVAGDTYEVRVQAWGTGTTNLRAKMWKTGTVEPSTWLANATDSTTSLQSAGGIGFLSYLSGSSTVSPSVRLDNLVAGATGN
jgi:PKD repeat protein